MQRLERSTCGPEDQEEARLDGEEVLEDLQEDAWEEECEEPEGGEDLAALGVTAAGPLAASNKVKELLQNVY